MAKTYKGYGINADGSALPIVSTVIVAGGQELNFEVVAYASESVLPETAAENTIVVFTSTPMSRYIFSAAEPDAPEEGMVWFAIGAASPTEFSATKNDSVMVYPISAKQYVDGAWLVVSAMSYQGGAWVSWWDGYLYNAGDECVIAGGEWISEAVPYSTSVSASVRTITKSSTKLSVAGVASKSTIIRKERKVNLSGKSVLEFVGKLYNPAESGPDFWASICVWSAIGATTQENVVAVYHQGYGTSSGTKTVDVSALSGEYYVGFSLHGSATLEMTSLLAK